MPHRTTDPHAPTVDSVNPSEPIRNPGLHSAMTNPSYQWSDFRSCRSSMTASATATSLRYLRDRHGSRAGIAPDTARNQLGRLPSAGGRGVRFAHAGCLEYDRRAMRGPPITVRCDCGTVSYVPYGETWRCERCGKRWNTAQIPSEQYWGILSEMRRYRLQAMGVAVGIAATFITLGLTVGQRFFVLAPIALGAWFLWYMPQWRRKVRLAAR